MVSTTTVGELKKMVLRKTVGDFKELESVTGLVAEVRLILAGKELMDNATVSSAGITHNATLHQCMRLRGGADEDPSNEGMANIEEPESEPEIA